PFGKLNGQMTNTAGRSMDENSFTSFQMPMIKQSLPRGQPRKTQRPGFIDGQWVRTTGQFTSRGDCISGISPARIIEHSKNGIPHFEWSLNARTHRPDGTGNVPPDDGGQLWLEHFILSRANFMVNRINR